MNNNSIMNSTVLIYKSTEFTHEEYDIQRRRSSEPCDGQWTHKRLRTLSDATLNAGYNGGDIYKSSE